MSLRDTLLKNAFTILDHAGPDAVTIRAVARASGVSHAAPANHFADRSELLSTMAAAIWTDYLAEFDRQLSQHPDRAKAYLLALAAYSERYPCRYDLIWRKDLTDCDNAQYPQMRSTAYLDFVQSLAVREGGNTTPGRGVDVLGPALWSMVHGYLDLRARGFFQIGADEVTGRPPIEALLALFLEG